MPLAAIQLNLKLDLPVTRPLIPMKAAMVLLDRGEDDVLAMIESGALAWAWDIKSAEAERREPRIWRESILVELQDDAAARRIHDGLDEVSVIESLLPHHGEEIRSTHLQRLFTASQGHIQHLIDQELLCGLNQARTGPNGFVRVTSASVITLLRSRRMT